jgi:type II restriction enzyme
MTISYDHVLQYIDHKPKDFAKATEQLHNLLRPWHVKSFRPHLKWAGTIPQKYKRDSSEEKLYSKYCDMVVLGFLELNGLSGELTKARGNRADVEAACGSRYRLVADAKAFRKSRSALNPKDYKIGELNIWRANAKADYACLVGSRFPKNKSRLFREAVANGVCLLRFTHLDQILAKHDKFSRARLRNLWSLPQSLKRSATRTRISSIDGTAYWQAVEDVINQL